MDVAKLFSSPDQYLLGFEGPDALFVDMDRAAYQRSIFFDRRIQPKSPGITKVPCTELHRHLDGRETAAPVRYIFHIAHCGSTLLARALDVADLDLVCREPLALRQLGGLIGGKYFGASAPDEWARRLKLATTLLARRYAPGAPVVVKANVPVNFILNEVMGTAGGAPGILLYFPLEDYLLAILRSAEHRNWVAGISAELAHGLTKVAGPADGFEQNTAVLAARLWLAQMLLFDAAARAFPALKSLNAEDLFNEPRETLVHAARHLELGISEAQIDEVVRSDLFSRYAKNPAQAFDNAARIERREALRRELDSEIKEGIAWVSNEAGRRSLPERLARPLFGEAKPLLGG